MKISRDLAMVTFSAFISLISGTLPLAALAQESFQTHRAIIYCALPSDLFLMEKRLNFWPTDQYFQMNHAALGVSSDPALHRLAVKVDGMMDRVSHLLDIRPLPSQKLRVFLLKDGRQVRERHLLFQTPRAGPLLGYRSLEAFYESGTHTLFLSLADLHEGILAHEIAHFLLCTCPAMPPANVQERWAQYAETHLR